MSSFWNTPAWTMGKRSNSSVLNNKFNVPGPGNYSSTTNIGKKNLGWKIGTSNRNYAKNGDTPGPGQYNTLLGRYGPKISIGAKSKFGSE